MEGLTAAGNSIPAGYVVPRSRFWKIIAVWAMAFLLIIAASVATFLLGTFNRPTELALTSGAVLISVGMFVTVSLIMLVGTELTPEDIGQE